MCGQLSTEQLLIRDQARIFTEKEVLPLANRLDPERGDMPDALIAKMAEMGYFGILIPERHGGLGLGALEYCLVAEELARGWMSVASIIARGNGLIGSMVMEEERKASILPRMARGEYLGAVALSEPDAGSDLANISCRAERDADGWVITGNKTWCTFADGADFIMVLVRTEPVGERKRHHGLSLLMIDKPRGSLPDRCAGSPLPKIGYYGWRTWDLSFDGCRVGDDALVGEAGSAFYYIARGLETARAHTAARAVGLAGAALHDAVLYAQQRRQFGQAIGSFQGIRFKLAEMATQIEAARQLTHSVCRRIDAGERCDGQAAMAKLFASEMAERVTSEALQIFGGAGYTSLHAVERHWRDARLTRIFEGTSEIQKRIIADELLGRV